MPIRDRCRGISLCGLALTLALANAPRSAAQQQEGPQQSAPAIVKPPAPPPAPQRASSADRIVVPAGTRFGVHLENGISTRNAKPGDSVYLRTSFPITQNNRIVIPVGSYLRGSLLDTKRPGKIKGKGEFRIRLDTLILPNGYTVNLNAAPRQADSGGKETMDEEGKVTGPSAKGKDATTIAETTAAGAGIGAIAGRAKGLGIGAGVGAAAGLAAVLLTRGPDAELPRGSSLDIVLERDLPLDANQIQFRDVGQAVSVTPPPAQQP
jgi:type IV secretion system protein VirB10